ncbi:NERD domain-containing protein [Streptomyces sp. NPDC095613]|uniref:nuclease-related domain-containing protein n=1 Tax=Streptomyces sp. NPDC095613 TaxID=3155540 RepID=UPI00332BE9CA
MTNPNIRAAAAAGGSAAQKAAVLRAQARRGLWRRILSWLGVSRHTRRADTEAARWAHGASGEATTARLLAALEARGWHVRHDLALPRSRANLDHLLTSPCGTALVVLDTKAWHRGRTTALVQGRVHCGREDRHGQVEKVAGYARRVEAALRMPGVRVWPLLVVHGSPVAGGRLEARVAGWEGVVHVLDTDRLLPTLVSAPKRQNPRAAAALAARVDQVFRPYVQGA